MRGRPKAELVLSEAEREQLTALRAPMATQIPPSMATSNSPT